MSDSRQHVPAGRWEFDEDVASMFDDMLRRSIPQYELMRELVFEVGSRFVRPDTHVVDLGCSRGEALAPFVKRFGDANRYVGVEVSPPMLEAAQSRFEREQASGIVEVRPIDLRSDYPAARASLTLAVLTLQFVPIDHRLRIVQDVYDHTEPGGAFILVEKVLGSSSEIDELLSDLYRHAKRKSGYSPESIERKRLSLEGVLVPVTAAWNTDLLSQAGFSSIDCFWRSLNFAGWVAVKRRNGKG